MRTAFLYARVFLRNLLRYGLVRRNPSRGLLIVIDGGEGAGKDHQIERLKEKYPDAVYSREPGGSEYAEEIRRVMLESPHARDASGRTQLLLVSAGRSDHQEKTIDPAILTGRNVLSNRGVCTTWGYQIGGQQGGYALKKAFFQVFDLIFARREPDLYIIMEVDPEEGARRVALRKGKPNHYDERRRDFHLRVMESYHTFARLYPFRVKFVDANKSKDEVFQRIDAIVGPLLRR
ncbi:MAG TPA: dTMP kinase [Candidatus Paceibacterota bacterium]|nr:dTMP kinase [Candidatus Paceibacterota bacterium]